MGKHFLSVLGTGRYSPVTYYDDVCAAKETCYIQEALLEMKFDGWNDGDKITIFLTKDSKAMHWDNGLKGILEEKYEGKVNAEMIPVGGNDKELWEIFETIYKSINEEEELYIDITHALRNIPIQMLAVATYARTVKKADIKGIYYGAYETGERNAEGIIDRAPVFDQLTFLNIIDWSQAARSFVKYGNSDQIADLYQQQKPEMAEIEEDMDQIVAGLQNITQGLETSRGYYSGVADNDGEGRSALASYYQYRQGYDALLDEQEELQSEQMIEPLKQLMGTINGKVERFDVGGDNLKFGLKAVEWAIENNRTQQGYTALEETIKTFLCKHYNQREGVRKDREMVCKGPCNSLVKIWQKHDRQDITDAMRQEAKVEWENYYQIELDRMTNRKRNEKIPVAHQIIDEVPTKLIALINKVSDERNSMNHFGFSINQEYGQFSCHKLSDDLRKDYERFQECMDEMGYVG